METNYYARIVINGNDELRHFAKAGKGEVEKPYIIEDIIADNNETENPNRLTVGLLMQNCTANFIIRDSTFSNFHIAVYLANCHNGLLQDNRFVSNEVGIAVVESREISMISNALVFKGELAKPKSTEDSFSQGIILQNSFDNYIAKNYAEDSDFGFFICDSSDNIIEDNRIERTIFGIRLDGAVRNKIESNIFSEITEAAIFLERSSGNILMLNEVKISAPSGLLLVDSPINRLFNNNITLKGSSVPEGTKALMERDYSAIFLQRSDNNLIENNIDENSLKASVTLYNSCRNLIYQNTFSKGVQRDSHSIDNTLKQNEEIDDLTGMKRFDILIDFDPIEIQDYYNQIIKKYTFSPDTFPASSEIEQKKE